ncbi:MAG: NYN domain-containing protein [Geminicoccaceae bacterium]
MMIDGPNFYQSARALGLDIDYRSLLDTFARYGRLVRACYYTALLDDQDYSPIRPLVDWLDYNGYNVVTKPIKEFTDAAGRQKLKGNMQIELAVDAMEVSQHLDHIVLFSGDGDFCRLIEALQRKGLRVTVVGTMRTQPSMIASELRRQADTFLELQELGPFIARKPREVATQV